MSKTITLKPRMPGANGKPTWHDYGPFGNALRHLARGQDLIKIAPWISIAGRMQLAAEESKYGQTVGDQQVNLPAFSFPVSNQQANILWDKLARLPLEAFGFGDREDSLLPTGTWYLMMCDLAAQLGKTMPESAEDDEEKPNEKS